MFKHPSEPLPAANLPHIDFFPSFQPDSDRTERPITKPLMRPVYVMIGGVGLDDVVQLSEAETEEMI